ncbi:MAG: 30S ribosomal protein S6 [Herpetosiphon sp.]
MRDYELMYVIAPNLGDDEACSALAEQLNQSMTNSGAAIKPSPMPQPIAGRRRLAYPIRRESRDVTEGFYVVTNFEAKPEAIREIDRLLKLSEPVMRYLITQVEPPRAVPQPEA